MHALARLLYQRLIEVPVGGQISYSDLSVVVNRDVQGPARGLLSKARRAATKRNRIVFDVEIDVGLRRVDDRGILKIGENRVVRVGRAAQKGGEIVAAADITSLDAAQARRLLAAQCQLGLARIISADSTAMELASRIDPSRDIPSLKEVATRTLRAFVDT